MSDQGGMPVEAADETTAVQTPLTRQVTDFVTWVGDGRKLTQKGAITLADARELVERLGTGDTVDPVIGKRTFKTKSSTELGRLTLIVEWAKAARLVRITRGRLLPVKKSAPLLGRPVQLWMRLFEVFGKLGPSLLNSGWGESLLRPEFTEGSAALFAVLRAHDRVTLDELHALVWEVVTRPYLLEQATEPQLETLRRVNDRDVDRTLHTLASLGAVEVSDESAQLSALGRRGMARLRGEPEPGDPVHRVLVTLCDVDDPPVWRRLLVPSAMPLRDLHPVLQAVMGWEDRHLYSFTDGRATYGRPDPELGFVDDARVRFGDLVEPGDRTIRYTYDFGDDWQHDLRVESTEQAVARQAYPRVVDGRGACPPEDCGGPPGYQELRASLADPDDDDHGAMSSGWASTARTRSTRRRSTSRRRTVPSPRRSGECGGRTWCDRPAVVQRAIVERASRTVNGATSSIVLPEAISR